MDELTPVLPHLLDIDAIAVDVGKPVSHFGRDGERYDVVEWLYRMTVREWELEIKRK